MALDHFRRASGALVIVLLGLVLAVSTLPGAEAQQELRYDQPFVMWSNAWNSYCVGRLGGTLVRIVCDAGETNPANAMRFVIRGGCGRILTDDNIKVSLAVYDPSGGTPFWCVVDPLAGNAMPYCNNNAAVPSMGSQWGFSNVVTYPTPYLGVNTTAVRISNTANGLNGWCGGQPSTSLGGAVQCNRASVGGWETFYLYPVAP
jgi:hypothetical protein